MGPGVHMHSWLCGYGKCFLLLLPLDFLQSFLYVAAMFKTTVIILSLVWASLLLISWGSAEGPTTRVSSIAFEQRSF